MADLAEKLSIATAIPAGPQALPSTIPPMSAPEAQLPPGEFVGLNRELWMMAARAALGATFGFLTGMGLWNELYFHNSEVTLVAIPLALAAYVLFDPIMKSVEGERETTAKPRTIAALGAGALASLVIAVLHHSLDVALDLDKLKIELGSASLANHPDLQLLKENLLLQAEKLKGFGGGLGVAAITFACIGLAVLAVTRLWAQGARRQPPRAIHWGVASGLTVGVFITVPLVRYLGSIGLLPSWQGKAVVGVLVLGWFLGPAFSGGLGIHKYRSGSKPTFGILLYLAVFSVVYVLLLLGASARSGLWALAGLPILALVLQNLGWALGPYLGRESCDNALCGLRSQTNQEREARGLGLVVTMPRSERVVSDAGSVTEPRPQDSLFKPRGDRLWATVALVLALITSALAYYAGTLRRDPELVLNIQNVFQQDSGLKSKDLKIHSDGRTVTVAGVVDNEAEHAKAVEETMKVRGVKQLIDRIQVAPSQPHTPINPAAAEVVPSTESSQPQNLAPAINATISIGARVDPVRASAVASPKATRPQNPVAARSREHAEPPNSEPKRKGLFGLLKKGKDNLPSSTTDAHKAGAQKTEEPSGTAGTQKHGLFHFLKKDKNKENNNNIKSGKNDTNNNKKNHRKDPTTH